MMINTMFVLWKSESLSQVIYTVINIYNIHECFLKLTFKNHLFYWNHLFYL